jgi:hypothetical protein
MRYLKFKQVCLEYRMPVTTRSKSKQCPPASHYSYDKQFLCYEKLFEQFDEVKIKEFLLAEIYILSALMCKYIYFMDNGILCKNKEHHNEVYLKMLADFVYLEEVANGIASQSTEITNAIKAVNNLFLQLSAVINKVK